MKVLSITLCFLVVILSGCSVNEPKTFQLKNSSLSDVWPSGSEVPRYRYVGELHGEASRDSITGRSVFEKIIGLIQGAPDLSILERPYDVYVSADDIVYVADLALPGVMVFNQKTNTVKVWDEIDSKTSFKVPVGIVGTENEILVVDSQWAQVFRFSPTGKLLGSFGENNLKRPIGIAYDAKLQRIYVSDAGSHSIQVFSLDGTLISTIGRHGEALGEFNYPSAIEFNHNKLYISDTMNARIQIIDPSNLEKEVESFGYRGLNVGNTPRPKGVTVDNDGNVYAVESYYGYLLVYNDQGEFLLPISAKNRKIGEFYLPSGVTTDANNRIYLADTFNGRVVIFQYLGD
jgi:DNA-binding beta-propeller fold protein YncE